MEDCAKNDSLYWQDLKITVLEPQQEIWRNFTFVFISGSDFTKVRLSMTFNAVDQKKT